MAWTLYILLGITVMTASAHKCKHCSSDHDLHIQNGYANQEPLEIPNNRAYERMNTRSTQKSHPVYPRNILHKAKSTQHRIGESTLRRQSKHGSRVLSWKPYAESRRGQNKDNSKIVVPEPTSEEFLLEIPDQCKKLGICEDVPNYPRKQAEKVISQIPDRSIYQNDELDLSDITHRMGGPGRPEENIDLCGLDIKIIYPRAAIDSNGKWYPVLNQDDDPLQGFKVEICNPDSYKCNDIATINPSYEGRCMQKFVYRKMAVLQRNGTYFQKLLKVPSCCSCVAKQIINNNYY